ncbi:MAG: hypothetical protein WCW13_02430 [archaeon]|jgi:hypothetical protein
MITLKKLAKGLFWLAVLCVLALIVLYLLVMGAFIWDWVFGFGHPTTLGSKMTIAYGLKGISPSGDTSTSIFDFVSNTSLTSLDINAKTGLDPRSIVFATGQFGVGSNINPDIKLLNNGSGIEYVGTSTLKVKARIICKWSGEKLEQYLMDFVSLDEYKVDVNVVNVCGINIYNPCCIVLLERPTN